tara:strand:+ start:352 stop:537 length:186 start_codon:yes stop_codon:yes gene_type:complete
MRDMTTQTEWEVLSFEDLVEIAADDDVTVSNESEMLDYLKGRSYDLEFEVRADGQYNVLFA